ncbi:MAG: type transport system permease protein [Acidobacteriota bacterium]|jgi:ABC-type multidrug transport system permease subunit|nr:type transport system permease protein [Acidobacteriota bacterium]
MTERGIINDAEEVETRPAVAPAKVEATGADGKGTRDVGGEPAAAKSFHPLVELTLARVREFLREPEVIFWVFVFPILLVFALGIAFRNTGPQKIRIGVEKSETNAQASSSLADALARSSDIEVVQLSTADATQALRSGKVALVVRAAQERGAEQTQGSVDGAKPEPGSSQASGSASSSFTYRFDPTRPESRQAHMVVDDALQRAAGRSDVAHARDETFTEPGARYIDFLIPGLLGMNLMGSGLWGIGFAVVNARTKKLLKRFAATPMRRSHYLLSFVLSRLFFLGLEVAVVIAFAWFAFGFTVRGSIIQMVFLLLLGALTFAGVGLLVASRPKTIEGVSGLMNLVMMPMWLLSGTFFSSARFPEFLQPFIKALPLTALNDSLRAVMNDGASLTGSWVAVFVLLAWCGISFIVALKIFRWQ